ncbi:DNA replication protein psf2 [Ophidiomyces ophidiicola]|uniref:DNA replication protein psf2 n=1 Tax=Ophidiomyces ophidiicola TaxID=1387563 RepID=UPI0020C1DE3F|nr:DNA replication protein psf2 [Ophidiomyces ophidiicola]KAI1947441.1 DNA replication protein psf2 [Ophidiomyces ophidiicola]KAI2059776.1 DNA replication protein psf2 [Ophidiomyces ophidiicola]KAI2092839.1 DNA replication protein psf2 [Ophidiomyces ophidiicola]
MTNRRHISPTSSPSSDDEHRTCGGMAFPLPRGLTPPEIAFLCEMEMVTVVPRQRLEGLELLGGPVEPLIPPRRSSLPLWLALLLKRQRRANILPPPWLNAEWLSDFLAAETDSDTFLPPAPLDWPSYTGKISRRDQRRGAQSGVRRTQDGQQYTPSAPFLLQNVVDDVAVPPRTPWLPYHWLELATLLLDSASDDLVEPDQIRRIIRDIREIRMAKMRKFTEHVDITAIGGGEGLPLTGVGAMEIGEARRFLSAAAETLRQIGASKEEALKEQAETGGGMQNDYSEDDDMEL